MPVMKEGLSEMSLHVKKVMPEAKIRLRQLGWFLVSSRSIFEVLPKKENTVRLSIFLQYL